MQLVTRNNTTQEDLRHKQFRDEQNAAGSTEEGSLFESSLPQPLAQAQRLLSVKSNTEWSDYTRHGRDL